MTNIDFPLSLPDQVQKKLWLYAEAVEKSPPHLHLTSEQDRSRFMERHVLDTLELLGEIGLEESSSSRLLDVGTGNGIPGLVIALARPSWHLILLDSDAKKIGFLESFCISHAIKNVLPMWGRAETAAHGKYRDAFDRVLARALAKLPTTIELSGGFVKPGGQLIVSHGTTGSDQAHFAQKAAAEMNLKWKFTSSTTFLTASELIRSHFLQKLRRLTPHF